ncbi:helix-turn-helix domain-containing protein [Noviherbaspirillum aridicola]|uniref:Winged helix-turn-helix domain-containing protein n=1 Tax=Noviherbaspirillum aridicola TaxID=2849687 RepID=A0ABQ4Q9Z6_9BURK|nr:helix-turn-helix domain-containing protein [Noviherbaspirillum aridicola]GIZ54061.1 hypothetical protein NCCP691_40750 [Noviherbaspirillum aridicola]
MAYSENDNATGQGGVGIAGGQAKAMGQNKVLECSADHITRLVRELQDNGVGLNSSAGERQLSTLPKVLAFLGDRGLNTYEGTAAGYARLATRIQDLEADGWIIESRRENVIGPDGLFHRGVARYILVGRLPAPQQSTPAEEVQ